MEIDRSYEPVVPQKDLRLEASTKGREDVISRTKRMVQAIKGVAKENEEKPGRFFGALLISHGGPSYRLVSGLTGQMFAEPPMGSVMLVIPKSGYNC